VLIAYKNAAFGASGAGRWCTCSRTQLRGQICISRELLGYSESLLQLSTFHSVCTVKFQKITYYASVSLDGLMPHLQYKKDCIFVSAKWLSLSVESRENNPGVIEQPNPGPLMHRSLKQNTVILRPQFEGEIVRVFSQTKTEHAPIIFLSAMRCQITFGFNVFYFLLKPYPVVSSAYGSVKRPDEFRRLRPGNRPNRRRMTVQFIPLWSGFSRFAVFLTILDNIIVSERIPYKYAVCVKVTEAFGNPWEDKVADSE